MLMIRSKQKLFFTAVILALLFCLAGTLVFAAKTEIQYPGATEADTATFPAYVKYLFNFSIIISGVIAFGVLVYNGFLYLTSAGEPGVMKDAVDKIIGAFLGVVILLSSYLILTTINPDLANLTLNELSPASGVYLIDAENKKHYVADSTPSLGFTPVSVQFISPKKDLLAVYERFDSSAMPIENTEQPNASAGFSSNSIYFLWNRPGVYLYPATDFKGYPRYLGLGTYNLSSVNFDNKTQSIKFINKDTPIGAVLFTDYDQRGKCAITGYGGGSASGSEISNLSSPPAGNYFGANMPGDISSLAVFYVQPAGVTGQVTFYDDIDCTGNRCIYKQIDGLKNEPDLLANKSLYFMDKNKDYKEIAKNFDGSFKLLNENIVSFEINGNFGVVLNAAAQFAGRCQLFLKPSGTNCVPTLNGSYVYDTGLSTLLSKKNKVRAFSIIPLSK